jgi:hypothetical protein
MKALTYPGISRYSEYEKLLDLSNRAEKLFLNGTIEIRRKVVETLFDDIKMYESKIVVSPKIQPFAAEVLGSVESGIQIV